MVTASLATIKKIEMPRSWSKGQRTQWLQLPYTLQTYVLKRETERDKALLKAQNQAAIERKKLNAQQDETSEAIQKPAA